LQPGLLEKNTHDDAQKSKQPTPQSQQVDQTSHLFKIIAVSGFHEKTFSATQTCHLKIQGSKPPEVVIAAGNQTQQ